MSELEHIRSAYAWDAGLELRFLELGITVYTNDLRLKTALGAYFAPYVAASPRHEPDALPVYLAQGEALVDTSRLTDVPRTPPARDTKEAFYDAEDARIVLKRRTGVVIYVAEPAHYVVGDLMANLGQATNAIIMVFTKAMLRRGYAMLHASAAVDDHSGVAFASTSGQGKSTMALLLVDHGYRFVTNDRLLVRRTGDGVEMVGVPKHPRVNPGTLLAIPRLSGLIDPVGRQRYARLDPVDLWHLEEKHTVNVQTVFGHDTARLRGSLKTIFLLHWGLNGLGMRLRVLRSDERRRSLASVAKDTGVYSQEFAGQPDAPAILDTVAEAIEVCVVDGRADVRGLAGTILARRVAGF